MIYNEQIESLETAVASIQQAITQMLAQRNTDVVPENDQRHTSVVSDIITKPRTFEEISYLQNAVSSYYDQRCGERMRELKELASINDIYVATGVLEPPDDMQDGIEMWDLYIKLLKQYCDDVSDLLVYSKQRVE